MKFLISIGIFFAAYSYITNKPVTELVDKDEVTGFVAETVETVRKAGK